MGKDRTDKRKRREVASGNGRREVEEVELESALKRGKWRPSLKTGEKQKLEPAKGNLGAKGWSWKKYEPVREERSASSGVWQNNGICLLPCRSCNF